MRDRYPDAERPARFDASRFQADEIKLSPPLASEPKDIVGYLRTGGCTAGCGACCEAFIVPLDPDGFGHGDLQDVVHERVQVPVDPTVIGKAGTDDWEYWLGLHDTFIFQPSPGLLVADLPVTAKKASAAETLDEWFAWLEEHGVAVLRREGQQVIAHISRKCDMLGEDGLCQLIGTGKRPQLCGPYPLHPTDIQGLGFCTYKFAQVEQAELMARGIIGQGRSRAQPKKKDKRKRRGKR